MSQGTGNINMSEYSNLGGIPSVSPILVSKLLCSGTRLVANHTAWCCILEPAIITVLQQILDFSVKGYHCLSEKPQKMHIAACLYITRLRKLRIEAGIVRNLKRTQFLNGCPGKYGDGYFEFDGGNKKAWNYEAQSSTVKIGRTPPPEIKIERPKLLERKSSFKKTVTGTHKF